jgi:hypothetical protein
LAGDGPSARAPQLARLVKTPPDADDWLHEIKFDGYRIGCRLHRQRPLEGLRTPKQRLTRPALAATLSFAFGNRAQDLTS